MKIINFFFIPYCIILSVTLSVFADEGDSLWSNTYGGNTAEYLSRLVSTTDDGYLLAGITESFGSGGWDFWIVRTDSDGDTLWTRTYGGGSYELLNNAIPTDDGGWLLLGDTYSFGAGNWDFWMLKVSADGDSLWSRTFGGSNEERMVSAIETSDGGYILWGRTSSFGAGSLDMWIVKTNASGDSLWSQAYGWEDDEWTTKVMETQDYGYLIAGNTTSCGAG